MKRLALIALVASLAAPARAESPRYGSFDLSVGQYRPNVDADPNLHGNRPWATVFGTGKAWDFRATASYALLRYLGALEVGLQTGYLQRSGSGLTTSGQRSGDTTAFRMIPTTAVLTYRFEWLADRGWLPLAPYGRLALERYNWWISGGTGSTARSGATNGWSAAAGLALMLDFFDPYLGRELDRDTGINHTFVFAEARKTKVNDFGSSTSWDLSDTSSITWAFGMLFVF